MKRKHSLPPELSLAKRPPKMSVIGGRAENICSFRVFLSLTLMYGPAARCKGFSSSCRFAVLHQCIRPLIGAFAPGHHGYQRACVLISGQASIGPFGSPVFACAGKTDPPSLLIPLADLGWKLLIGLCHRLLLISPSSFVRAKGPFLRPGLQNVDRVARRGGQGRPSRLACGGLRRCQAAP